MEDWLGHHAVSQRPLTAAAGYLNSFTAHSRSASAHRVAQDVAAAQHTQLRPLRSRLQASWLRAQHGLVHGEVLNGVDDEGELGEHDHARWRW